MKGTKKWSRNWADFDWSPVIEKLSAMKEGKGNVGYDAGISRDEFLEYLEWLSQSDKEEYYKAILSMQLSEMGLNASHVKTLVAHPDELTRIMESFLQE